ncbi:response regulator [Candidatus Synechococcus calcipolaris G9]|uniref:Response regulator n=1 Tax=Candidatus Synechococcus calcipolaris G9 TaxID=1497997 RepID=A0ABT6EUQ8_9SYNE|nr:response regulator [Candidatus Synechococcus calcipolaris]MDG2989575.1 response regulator [Candidatus Synechococcus calcipolaris G9]
MSILIVEDDLPTAAALVSLLTAENYPIDLVPQGVNISEYLQNKAYKLLVVDCHSSDLDRLHVYQKLRLEEFEGKVLLLISGDRHPDAAIAIADIADDYLMKPFDPQDLVQRVRNLLGQPLLAPASPDLPLKTPSLSTADSPHAGDRWVLHIDDDTQLLQELEEQSIDLDLSWCSASTWPAALAILEQRQPNVVILNPNLAPSPEESVRLLTDLGQQSPAIPSIVFTEQDTWRDRLAAIRLGGRVCLSKPIRADQVLTSVQQLLQRQDKTQANILTVDDDPVTLAVLKRLLEPWGMRVTAVQDPQRFWDVLEETNPDLLVLDVQMPGINGIELCQVVRNDSRWSRLPILFLTASRESALVTQLFAAGADDFVNKPIVGPELITRIVNRLDRTRLLKSLAEIDPLTGVANRRKATEDIDKFIDIAQEYQQSVCVALLDLDHFKQINDRYGHDVGDDVLVTTARILRQSLRSEDVVARWGGEEFLLGMYGVPLTAAHSRLQKCLDKLSQYTFKPGEQAPFQVSFSAGIAQFPHHGQDLTSLYRMADTYLYEAKAAGRRQIISATINPNPTSKEPETEK